jgi:hypothetical protein
MADSKAVPIDKESIPYRFDIPLAGEIFTLEVHYNATNDFFTVDIEKNGTVLVYGEKLTYGNPLFSSLTDKRLPKVLMTPYDVARRETRVSYENLGESVFLFVGES